MDVLKVAKLAKLRIDDKEATALAAELETFLAYAKDLDSIPGLERVVPTAHALLTKTPLREDVVAPGLADPAKNAPDKEGTAFRVPKVID